MENKVHIDLRMSWKEGGDELRADSAHAINVEWVSPLMRWES
jgi:hypothetical protein